MQITAVAQSQSCPLGGHMRNLIKLVIVALLAVNTTACVASVQVASRADVVSIFDNRPRLQILFNGTDADVFDVESDRGQVLVRGGIVGKTVIIPVNLTQQYGEQRTYIVKGFKLIEGSNPAKYEYVGFRCRQVYFSTNQQAQPWVVDRLIRPGEQSGGCY